MLFRSLPLLLALVFAAPYAQSAPDDPADRQALENVWAHTLVVFPVGPDENIARGRNLDRVLSIQPVKGKLPAVVYLHGCSGLHLHSTQRTRKIRDLAAAGLVVFAPDSLARPVETYCDPVTLKSRIGFNEIEGRIAEAKMVRDRIAALNWIDSDNIFLVGHSMGAMTVQNYSGNDFRAHVILGYHCGPHRDRRLEGIKSPANKPILSLIGDADEWFVNGPNRGIHCGMYMRNYPNSRSVVYPGIPHDITQHPDGMREVISFLKQNATRPIEAAVVESRGVSVNADGAWSGSMNCVGSNGRPFSNLVNLNVVNGRFEWRTQVAAGLRGFFGQITEPGFFIAHGNIGKDGLMETVKSSSENIEVKWAISFGGFVDDDLITADGSWGASPCQMTLRRRK